tara:strand:- start:784 stop:1107 length:324 start_codon:yes stop_codon:yes gene_type:complete
LREIEGAELVEITLSKIFIQANPGCVNQRDGKGRTPLILALQVENYSVLRLLLEQGADPSKVDSQGANHPPPPDANRDHRQLPDGHGREPEGPHAAIGPRRSLRSTH